MIEMIPFLPTHWYNGKSVRQWPERPGFSHRSSHTKGSKMVLDASLLNIQDYKVRIKGKWSDPEKKVAAFPIPKCSSYRKGNLRGFIIKGFRTTLFIFIIISTTFRLIYLPAFFRCLSNSGTFTELQTTSFIESIGVACSDSISHNRVQVLSIPVLYFLFLFIHFFSSSSLLNYRFPYCIQLYTWSTQQVIVAQHVCWFLKASNPPIFSPINYFNFIP